MQVEIELWKAKHRQFILSMKNVLPKYRVTMVTMVSPAGLIEWTPLLVADNIKTFFFNNSTQKLIKRSSFDVCFPFYEIYMEVVWKIRWSWKSWLVKVGEGESINGRFVWVWTCQPHAVRSPKMATWLTVICDTSWKKTHTNKENLCGQLIRFH